MGASCPTCAGMRASLTVHKQQMEGGYDSEPKRSSDPGSKLPVRDDTYRDVEAVTDSYDRWNF